MILYKIYQNIITIYAKYLLHEAGKSPATINTHIKPLVLANLIFKILNIQYITYIINKIRFQFE